MEQQDSLFGDGEGGKEVGEILIPGAEIELYPHALGRGFADEAFDGLRSEIEWQQDHIVMVGKRIPLPRLTAWFSDPGRDYTYSGIAMPATPWIPLMSRIRAIAEDLSGEHFNSVLCNLHRSGDDGLAWHSDDEPELGPQPTLASVNLGATRRFLVRRRDDHSIKTEIPLGHGDVLVMKELTQALCEHSVPKTKKARGPMFWSTTPSTCRPCGTSFALPLPGLRTPRSKGSGLPDGHAARPDSKIENRLPLPCGAGRGERWRFG